MGQYLNEFIITSPLHILFLGGVIILAIVGLIEIICQIYNAKKKIKFIDEYIKHIDNINTFVVNRLEKESRGESIYKLEIDEIMESLHFIEVNDNEANDSIGIYHYGSNPIYSLSSILYYHNTWDDRAIFKYCHQIFVDYEKGRKKIIKEKKRNYIFLIIPFAKLYRGFCILFRLLTFPIKNLYNDFDKSRKWEKSIAFVAEIFTLINAIIKFVKLAS